MKIDMGNVEQASAVLTELSKFEGGNMETLDEASKEVDLAFNNSKVTVVVISSPQPLQLKYKSSTPDVALRNGASGGAHVGVVGEDEEESDPLALILAVCLPILVILLLVCVLVSRQSRKRKAQKALNETSQTNHKVDPNPNDEADGSTAKESPMPTEEEGESISDSLRETGAHQDVSDAREIALEMDATCDSTCEAEVDKHTDDEEERDLDSKSKSPEQDGSFAC